MQLVRRKKNILACIQMITKRQEAFNFIVYWMARFMAEETKNKTLQK